MRRAVWTIHIALLAAATAFGAVAIFEALGARRIETAVVVTRVALAAVLVLTAIGHLYALTRRGFTIAAPLMFGLSFGLWYFYDSRFLPALSKDIWVEPPKAADDIFSLYANVALTTAPYWVLALATVLIAYRSKQGRG